LHIGISTKRISEWNCIVIYLFVARPGNWRHAAETFHKSPWRRGKTTQSCNFAAIQLNEQLQWESLWQIYSLDSFQLVFHYNHWCILSNNKVIGYFETFSFWWDIHTAPDFGDFDPLTLNFNTLDTQKAHPCAKRSLLSHNTSKSVANCVL